MRCPSLHSRRCSVSWPGCRDLPSRWAARACSSSRFSTRPSCRFPEVCDVVDRAPDRAAPGAHALLRAPDDARLDRRVLRAYSVGRQGGRGVPAQALPRAPRRSGHGRLPPVRHAGDHRAVAAAAADAVQDLRAGGRRGRGADGGLPPRGRDRPGPALLRRGPPGALVRRAGHRRSCARTRHTVGLGLGMPRWFWASATSGGRSGARAGRSTPPDARFQSYNQSTYMQPEISVIVPMRNEAPNVAELYRELTATLERVRPSLRDHRRSTTAAPTRRSSCWPQLQAADSRLVRDPLPPQLRPDRRVRRRLRARARRVHRHLRRRPPERPRGHPAHDRARGTDQGRHRRRLAQGPEGSVLQPAPAVDDRQLDHLAVDRRPAARLRLLAEGVSRRSREADEALRRDAPVPAGHRQRAGRHDRGARGQPSPAAARQLEVRHLADDARRSST